MPPSETKAPDVGTLVKRVAVLEKNLTISHRNRARLEDVREKNQRLLETVNSELEDALNELKRAQASLIQSEKLAALGQLTAGIAHEIKNPLNFVNNFSEVSSELMDELQQLVGPLLVHLDPDAKTDALELFVTLTGNLAKIKEHGARADGIVRGMLSHAREGPSTAANVDLNALLEECLNLAYHGMRAEHQDFNVSLERDLDRDVGEVELFPQEFSRALLNFLGNGFYAVRQRQLLSSKTDYSPAVRVSTRNLGEEVEVRIRDNGTGIAAPVRDKIFNPFFTTKPAGEGTGLGLSLSYETFVQQHAGRIKVDTQVGEFTEFVITVPRKVSLPRPENT